MDEKAKEELATELYQYSRQGKLGEVERIFAEHPDIDPDAYPAYDGSTALVMAVKGGHVDVAKKLIEKGANFSETTTDDMSNVLHLAVKFPAMLELLFQQNELLLKKGDGNKLSKTTETTADTPEDAPPRSPLAVDATNEDCCTALHLAVYYNVLESVRVLVEIGGADVNLTCPSEPGSDDLVDVTKLVPEGGQLSADLLTYLQKRLDPSKLKAPAGDTMPGASERYGYGCFDR